MKLPFGKYAGEELDDIPLQYLEWLSKEMEGQTWREHPHNAPLQAALRREIKFRTMVRWMGQDKLIELVKANWETLVG